MNAEVEHISLCPKTYFINEQFAKDYIKKLNATSVRSKKPVRAYLCDVCLNWHLTSQTEHQFDILRSYKQTIKIKNAEISNLQKLVKVLKKEIHDLKYCKK